MHLTSTGAPNGPESTGHYLIVHHNNHHDLLPLPDSYASLEAEIEKLYHIDRGQFYLETDELSMCRGTKVRIPEIAWSDIAQLLGNLHVVPCQSTSNVGHPECAPEGKQSLIATHSGSEAHRKSEVVLNYPFNDESILMVKLTGIDFEAPTTPAMGCKIQLLDGNGNGALAISIFPHSILLSTPNGEASFLRTIQETFTRQAEHEVVIRKELNWYNLICDQQVIGKVEGSSGFFLTSVTYDLGIQTPFKGPVVANIFKDSRAFTEKYPLYKSTLWIWDHKALYQKVVACNPSDAGDIAKILTEVRGRGPNTSGPGMKWRDHAAPKQTWVDIKWDMHKKSIFVTRFTYPQGATPQTSYIVFNPNPGYSLAVTIGAEEVQVGDCNEGSHIIIKRGSLHLPHPPQSPGEHTIAFINHEGNIHIIVDFCKSFLLPNTTVMARKPTQIYFNVPADRILGADVYEFDQ